jgi:ribosomal-protein-alanine N-acetyltransferase
MQTIENTPEFAVRRARKEDLPQVLAIEEAWDTTPGWSGNQFEAELDSGRARFLVAESGSAVVGYVVLWVVGLEAQLLTIAVRPDAAKQGCGRRLLAGAVSVAAAWDCSRMTLEVSSANPAAMRLYESEGFHVVGRRASYYPDGSDALLMDKVLPVSP